MSVGVAVFNIRTKDIRKFQTFVLQMFDISQDDVVSEIPGFSKFLEFIRMWCESTFHLHLDALAHHQDGYHLSFCCCHIFPRIYVVVIILIFA
jgi:hypothetical protein